jgi:signal transduction histidine kinase
MLLWSGRIAGRIKRQLASAQRRADIIVIAFALAVLVVTIGSQLFFRRAVIVPLQALERGAELVGTGRFDHRIEPRAEDEIGHLADAFNRMTDRLKELTRSREEFISAAIHEIKTPVTVIKTSAQLMHRISPAQRDARYPDLLARIDRQCNRLTRLVTGVLEVLRLEQQAVELRLRRTDLAELVARVVDEMQEFSARHRLRIIRNDPMEAMVDPDRIEQVLANVIDNAIKYSPSGGDVEIESRLDDGSMRVMVHDRGIGIPRGMQGRVFERFYRAHAGTPYDLVTSLGVGLYLSRELVVRHGGQMWFESEEGRGSRFFFAIPLSPPGEEAEP